ncbi:MAG: hypothetical protein CMI54_04270 [Parcubacteria group bacterium]|nr:hypothetical protein [Parcubacteria group bacterium]|tara:strand:+ start:6478 stop:6900 length:423 start_codon:yes stop_codon:yes gene_type:complete
MAEKKSATKVELTNSTGFPRRYTVASGVAIAKNTVLTLSDPRTAAEVAAGTPLATGYYCAGIASMDKSATDGATSISAWTDGIFEVACSGFILAGQSIKSCGDGYFCSSAMVKDAASGMICGYALESGDDDEVINARIRV